MMAHLTNARHRGAGGRGRGPREILALGAVSAGGLLVFMRFYGSEKRCHAHQLAVEQMAARGCGLRARQTRRGARTPARPRSAASRFRPGS